MEKVQAKKEPNENPMWIENRCVNVWWTYIIFCTCVRERM